ncbi:hypothetical protein D9757_005626 [Collybiopsis confluens]|uniref:Apurinic-apyrimidinic endonuclease 1 n=1 Tax=Collybiopsis confluens TaxID=2823264 RepID=A0A8H5HT90_9AGAR|nr:hypothetical protein D9757_005626 [Collybiopsis confluens]
MARNINRNFSSSMAKRKSNVILAAVEATSQTVTKKARIMYESEDIEDVTEPVPHRASNPWKVGAHVSAAGGVENAILNASKIGANAFALFLKSQRKWTSPPLRPESISTFKSSMKEYGYGPGHVLPHGSYLINLGNPDSAKREKSYDCFLDDLRRCEQLGLELYNFHPGSTVGLATPSESIAFIAECINRAHQDTKDSKAGSGNVIGSDFAHLGEIISQVEDKTRIGVCLDTCHMFAAGYDIRTKEGWLSTVTEFDTRVGLEYLRGMHLNDSKEGLGLKKDRHENLGIGHLSLSAFAHILTDPRMQDIPLILETPSHEETSKDWGVWQKELEVLNKLSKSVEEGGRLSSEAEYDQLTQEIREAIKAASRKARKSPTKDGSKKGK